MTSRFLFAWVSEEFRVSVFYKCLWHVQVVKRRIVKEKSIMVKRKRARKGVTEVVPHSQQSAFVFRTRESIFFFQWFMIFVR